MSYYLSLFRNLKGRKRISDAFRKRAWLIFHGLFRGVTATDQHYLTQNVLVAFPRGLAILGFQFPFDPLLWEANSGKILKTLFYEQALGAENEISFLSAARRNYIFTRACPLQRSVWSQLSPWGHPDKTDSS